jgi:hypothetical protein
MLNGPVHWTEAGSPAAAGAGAQASARRRRERQVRARLLKIILKPYGLTLNDWSGTAYLLSSQTGRTELVNNLGELWGLAERILGRSCDPLDENFLSALATQQSATWSSIRR